MTATLLVLMLAATPVAAAFAQDAQGSGSAGQSAQDEESVEDERRVRRLGDVESDEYEIDLAVPRAPAEPTPSTDPLPLGDPELEARLQRALGILAIRQGDRQALAEVDDILAQAVGNANRLIDRGDLESAREVLNSVRQVDPNFAGQGEAWSRMAEAEKATTTRPREFTGETRGAYIPESSQKLNTVTPESQFDLPNPAQAERLDQLLSMIAARPDNAGALSELDDLLDDLLVQARTAIADGDFTTAAELLSTVRAVNPRKRGLAETRRQFAQATEIDDWLAAAEEAERQGALIEPRLESAYYWYRRVLSVDIDNPEALRGLQDIQEVMVVYALDAARAMDFELANAWLEEAATIIDNPAVVAEGRREVEAYRAELAAGYEEAVLAAIRAEDYNLAEFTLIDLIALGGYESRVTELRAMMNQEQSYGAYTPGEVVQDPFEDGSGYAPAVVVINSGSFLMGSPNNERERTDSEGPQHRVTFDRGFGLGQKEVTVGQFGSFVRATGYVTEAERGGQSSVWDDDMGQLADRRNVNWRHDFMGIEAADNLPVIHVTWNDATAYLEWLSAQTGARYRLPSEAEFEYAIRAGTRSPHWWGDGRPKESVENLAGQEDRSASGRGFSNFIRGYGDGYFGPAPVGSFQANPFGVHDLAGNVSEWIQDCWHTSYVRAPVNGQAWENPGCNRRVVRGGYWASSPRQVRSAARMSAPVSLRTPQVGFRVARDLW
ncbi:MAG: formylglycine-generating enzyme family protein [Xanthomonadales bacterium]|jgi:formylglycine-generating enzyme required for sulfatase activity|nr:formylglycine-generating enzyme family protein [Xanthomonadales bacterium]